VAEITLQCKIVFEIDVDEIHYNM